MIVNLGALIRYTDFHFRDRYENSRKKKIPLDLKSVAAIEKQIKV